MERKQVVRGDYDSVIPGGELGRSFETGGVSSQKVFDVQWITCLEYWNVGMLKWMYKIDK